jgi:hypothetical protein
MGVDLSHQRLGVRRSVFLFFFVEKSVEIELVPAKHGTWNQQTFQCLANRSVLIPEHRMELAVRQSIVSCIPGNEDRNEFSQCLIASF